MKPASNAEVDKGGIPEADEDAVWFSLRHYLKGWSKGFVAVQKRTN